MKLKKYKTEEEFIQDVKFGDLIAEQTDDEDETQVKFVGIYIGYVKGQEKFLLAYKAQCGIELPKYTIKLFHENEKWNLCLRVNFYFKIIL